jgi:aspartyl-tRNA synthetase
MKNLLKKHNYSVYDYLNAFTKKAIYSDFIKSINLENSDTLTVEFYNTIDYEIKNIYHKINNNENYNFINHNIAIEYIKKLIKLIEIESNNIIFFCDKKDNAIKFYMDNNIIIIIKIPCNNLFNFKISEYGQIII